MGLKPRIRFAVVQIAVAVGVIAALCLSYPSWRLGQISDRIRRQYPDVQQISTSDLAAWQASSKTAPVLIDVRTPEEFAVSHLIKAYRVDPDAEPSQEDLPEDHGRAIVVYCSTGDRSAAYARRLQRAGYSRVLLLEGAIVRWANEGRPLTDERQLVTRVHPDDARTAGLLKGAHRAATPATK